MNKKQQFLNVVEILAPDDPIIREAAQAIPEEKLPSCPGAAALEFVMALMKLRKPLTGIEFQEAKNDEKPQSKNLKAEEMKSAAYWVRLAAGHRALSERDQIAVQE